MAQNRSKGGKGECCQRSFSTKVIFNFFTERMVVYAKNKKNYYELIYYKTGISRYYRK